MQNDNVIRIFSILALARKYVDDSTVYVGGDQYELWGLDDDDQEIRVTLDEAEMMDSIEFHKEYV